MTHTITWIDRLRIERAVWALDQRLYDLPRKSRIANRREVRENLITATRDIGARDALHNLGDSRRLAAEYLSAQFGDEARPSWIAAGVFFLTGQLILTSILTEAALAFGHGITTANPNATGSFTWPGIKYLQDTVTYTFVDGKGDWVGGAWTPVAWALWIVATICIGRLWRLAGVWRRRHQAA
ncbi:MAG: hypothetical protein ABI862_00890 [Ilumatobacteraceae bacterium]